MTDAVTPDYGGPSSTTAVLTGRKSVSGQREGRVQTDRHKHAKTTSSGQKQRQVSPGAPRRAGTIGGWKRRGRVLPQGLQRELGPADPWLQTSGLQTVREHTSVGFLTTTQVWPCVSSHRSLTVMRSRCSAVTPSAYTSPPPEPSTAPSSLPGPLLKRPVPPQALCPAWTRHCPRVCTVSTTLGA